MPTHYSLLYIKFNIGNPEKFEAFQKVFDLLHEIRPKQEQRPFANWMELIPPYACEFISVYYGDTPEEPREDRHGLDDMIDYLQMNMEVELHALIVENKEGVLELAPYAWPFGGLDRLKIFLRAFECTPTEAYNGFNVYSIQWTDDFEYDYTELPEKTKAYRATWQRT